MIEKREFKRLVRSASKGDAEAFGRLFDRYYDAVFVYAHHHVGKRSDAGEITSGVFLAALENIGSVNRGGEGFGSWLFSIARNDINDFKRKRGRFKEAAATGEVINEAPADGKAVTRKVLLAYADSLAGERARLHAGGRHPANRRLLAPLAVAAALVLFTGTAWASSGASPDSPLYPLKERLEDVRTFLAMQGLDKAAAETGRAGSRLDEILEMVDRNRPGYVPNLLANCDRHIERAATLADEAGYRGGDTTAVEELIEVTLERRLAVLKEIRDRLPDDVRAAIADELLALEEGKNSGFSVTVAAAPAAQPPAPDAATATCIYNNYAAGDPCYNYPANNTCYYTSSVYVAATPLVAAAPAVAAPVAPPPPAAITPPAPSPPPVNTGNGGGNDDDNPGNGHGKTKKPRKHRGSDND